MNCTEEPAETVAGFGVTAIETSAGGPTVNVVDPDCPPKLAPIIVAPCASVLASPVMLTVETELFDDVQFAEFVTF